jgi:XTP/dITP diphosphohydrolase
VGITSLPEENGSNFRENAILKARFAGDKSGLWTLAEDSGLVIDALGGRPGIRSARYSEGPDKDRVLKVLDEMKNFPDDKRTARFIANIALYSPLDHSVQLFEGISEGTITYKPIGENGFGYDPIFYNLELGKTNASATLEEKNNVSHRGKAIRKVKKYLLNLSAV